MWWVKLNMMSLILMNLKEQRIFMLYKNKLIECSSEKVDRALFSSKNNVILSMFLLFRPYSSVHNKHFCLLKQMFSL